MQNEGMIFIINLGGITEAFLFSPKHSEIIEIVDHNFNQIGGYYNLPWLQDVVTI